MQHRKMHSLIQCVLFALIWMASAACTDSGQQLGAGFRHSTYGPPYDPGPNYWVAVGKQMQAKFDDSVPQTIWIVGNKSGNGSYLNFPSPEGDYDYRLQFSLEDDNEETLTLFDEKGFEVWLQVEPGNAPVPDLIHALLKRYGHHPSVIGVGIDVEWYKARSEPEGEPVTDEEAAAWVELIRSYNPDYQLFLKHWLPEWMPPNERDGIVFVDDSQGFESLDAMEAEFSRWAEIFAPAPVAFQYGYAADEAWWSEFDDPPRVIGDRLVEAIPNTVGLYWVDFTALDVFPIDEQSE